LRAKSIVEVFLFIMKKLIPFAYALAMKIEKNLKNIDYCINDLKNYDGGQVYLIGCKSNITCEISKKDI